MIFHTYVSLPEGTHTSTDSLEHTVLYCGEPSTWLRMPSPASCATSEKAKDEEEKLGLSVNHCEKHVVYPQVKVKNCGLSVYPQLNVRNGGLTSKIML